VQSKKVRTIYDLAALAGVSAGTVSRALAGKSIVNADTAERIRSLAREHDFHPSATARNLRTKRSGAIGVVIPLGHDRAQHISDPFFMMMIGCLADALTERGYDLVLSRVIPSRADWLDRIIEADRFDGLIVIGQSDQSATLDLVAQHYRPMVVWGGFSQGQIHCSVGTDNFLGGHLAASFLMSRGCRRIGFFGNPQAIEIRQRLEGARAAIAASPDPVALIETPTHLASELSASEIAGFLDSTDEMPDGIFAASDMVALAAIQVLTSRGVAVPEQVKVLGYDDLPVAQGSIPPLTTIRQDIASGALQLVDCLLKRIAGKATGSIILTPELILRGSA